ncbi:unnamed protein product, partial [marine sediment metagenome]
MTVKTLERQIAKIRLERKSNPVYVLLVEKFPPRPIASRKEHEAYLELIKMLMREVDGDISDTIREGIDRYLKVIAPFVEEFEKSRWPRKEVGGREILAYLLENNEMTQSDLEKEIGKQPYVSDILKGKKRAN